MCYTDDEDYGLAIIKLLLDKEKEKEKRSYSNVDKHKIK